MAVMSRSSARALMVCATGSDAGKSVIVAGLARAFANRGLRVEPFKPQNMSNNAAAVAGGEIGRAQALQARAARVEPCVDHNPVLLKPERDRASQVIVQGQSAGVLNSRDWRARRAAWMDAVLASFARLTSRSDLVIVEGAGSPAETNLREGDIANLGFAARAGVPVILLGDIDRGGVIASLVGTHAVLDVKDQALIRGFVINKFRGDPSLFEPAMSEIGARTGWGPLGIIPWIADCARLPSEDGVALEALRAKGIDRGLNIAVPMLSRISNFDDFDPFAAEPSVSLQFIAPGRPLPRDADLILLPGTKSTLSDLAFLRDQGWDIDIAAHVRAGGRVFGVCGGFQMLARSLSDPDGVDGPAGKATGLDLIPFDIEMRAPKIVRPMHARTALGPDTSGYEIHAGRPVGSGEQGRPLYHFEDGPDGWISGDGRIAGGHLHGCFSNDAFRAAFLKWAGGRSELSNFEAGVDAALDGLASALEDALDLDALLALAQRPGWSP